ncbi:hypothetical protein N7466_005569 [Penicillium verhagenii]|uniref:uncharacterized protein n=1 Tax=Penicillium verhagenii TaxID=1562060 RepID=UPI00254523A8|nr:uncharacterized protein N7466_005569 [Penicillium verhagenii]KAJ5930076.1 hypothetical protein N7466_005569 [Penicillium verhagenii]
MINCLSVVQQSNANAWGEFNIDLERTFFNETNVGDFIDAYFEHTVRPRSRIVLKSSFNLKTTSAPLLLAMFLLGASCGLSETAKLEATTYIDMAEHAVFEDPTFHRLVYNEQSLNCDSLDQAEIETIQAAVLIILIQLASPKAEARRRPSPIYSIGVWL